MGIAGVCEHFCRRVRLPRAAIHGAEAVKPPPTPSTPSISFRRESALRTDRRVAGQTAGRGVHRLGQAAFK